MSDGSTNPPTPAPIPASLWPSISSGCVSTLTPPSAPAPMTAPMPADASPTVRSAPPLTPPFASAPRIDSCGRAEIIGCIRGAVEIRSHSGQLGAEVACRTACVSGCLIGERFQFLQLVLQLLLCALGDGHGDIRLDLTGDAADVLAAVDRAGVRIIEQIPARHARNAADVVADVLIADRAGIFADCDRPVFRPAMPPVAVVVRKVCVVARLARSSVVSI